MIYDIGVHLRRLREERRWSQEEAAARAGFDSAATISHIETGRRLSFRSIALYARIFNLTLGLYWQPEVLSSEEKELLRLYRANEKLAAIEFIAKGK